MTRNSWFKRQALPALMLLGLFLMSVSAWADEDERLSLDPAAKKAQLWAFGVIGGLIVLGVGFYYFRRWQTLHSGNVVQGSERDED